MRNYSHYFTFGGGFIPLNNRQKRAIFFRILGYNAISAFYVLVGVLITIFLLGLLFFRLGPREQYYFFAALFGIVVLLSASMPIIVLVFEAEVVEDLVLIKWYDEVASNTKIFGFIPLTGVFRPILYHAKMSCPNACSFGVNLFGLAKLPIFGSAIMLSDELLELYGNNKQQLQAVIAHELGHITSFDVGIVTGLAVLGSVSKLFYRSGLFLRVLIGFEFILLLPIWLAWKIIGSSLSQLRELVADLKSVQSTQNHNDLINALSRLAEHDKFASKQDPFSELFISHPLVKDRVDRLKEIGELDG